MTSFEQLYAPSQVKQWGLQASDSLNDQGQARGLVLRWSTLQADFQKLGPDPSTKIWYVVCDVLILDDDPTVEDTLWIYARRIELDGERTLTIDGASATATIVAQEIVAAGVAASLPIMFLVGDGDPTFNSLTPLSESPATLFSLAAPATVTTEAWNATSAIANGLADNLNDGEPLRLGAVTIFQVASLLAPSNPTLAISQFQWIAAIADVNAATRVLAGQARTQLAWLVAESQGLVTVPPLDFTVYSDAATARVQVLQARSDAYDEWVQLERTNANWLNQAKLAVALQQNESQLTLALQQRAQSAYDQATSAEASATVQLNALRAALTNAELDFEAGVEIWVRETEEHEALELVKDVVSLGVAVGKLVAMVALPGAGAAGAGGATGAGTSASESDGAVADESGYDADDDSSGTGVVSSDDDASGTDDDASSTDDESSGTVAPGTGATSSGAAAKTTSSTVSSQLGQVKDLALPLGEAGVAIQGIVNSAQQLVEIGKTADRMRELAADSLKTVDGGLKQTFTASPLSGLDTVTGGSQVWQSLETAMDDSFDIQKALLNEIGGGPGFRVAFRQLVIGAEAYCSARLAVAAAANGLAEAKLRSKAATQAADLTTTYAQQLATNESLYQQLQQAAFGSLLEAKLAVYLELEKYQRAIRYFTLTDDPPPLPDTTASVIDFIKASGAVSGYELALEELSPAPQPMTGQTVSFAITDQQRTSDGAIVVQIDLNDPRLADCARVRIDRIEVGLAGEDGQTIPVSSLHIGSGGTYADRMPDGTSKTFTGNPWLKLVKYDQSGAEVVSAGTYSRYGDLTFKPTPFTTWTIRPTDPSVAPRVKSVTLWLTGEVSDTIGAPA
jgi:hypothetical protein